MARDRKLYISVTDRKIAGLCSGIATYYRVDSTVVRLAWVVVTSLTGFIPGIVAYVVGSLVVPKEPLPGGP